MTVRAASAAPQPRSRQAGGAAAHPCTAQNHPAILDDDLGAQEVPPGGNVHSNAAAGGVGRAGGGVDGLLKRAGAVCVGGWESGMVVEETGAGMGVMRC